MELNERCDRKNAAFYKECLRFYSSFEDIFKSKNPHILIRNLKHGRVFFKRFPEFKDMNFIYQDKKRNSSLFDHSLKVLEYTYEETEYPATLMAAFLHDYGKIFTYNDKFLKHDEIGISKATDFLKDYKIPKDVITDVRLIMRTHTRASQFQRNPNWSDKAIIKFIRESHPLTIETIKVAKADKRSSHDYAPYLRPYEDLKDRCLEIFRNGIYIS